MGVLHIRIKGIQTVLGHAPISAEATFVPDDFSGYETWREAFICQEAGVLTIQVKEILNVVVQGPAAGLTKPKQDFNPVFLKTDILQFRFLGEEVHPARHKSDLLHQEAQ